MSHEVSRLVGGEVDVGRDQVGVLGPTSTSSTPTAPSWAWCLGGRRVTLAGSADCLLVDLGGPAGDGPGGRLGRAGVELQSSVIGTMLRWVGLRRSQDCSAESTRPMPQEEEESVCQSVEERRET